MNAIGLDIGTTTLSAVALSEGGRVLEAVNLPNGSDIPDARTWAHLQDPDAIADRAIALTEDLMARHAPIGAMGLDGQMHGALYVDRAGRAVSPLATWQDARGELPFEGGTYVSELARRSGRHMATGFGLTTHFWNLKNGAVPDNAAKLISVTDYVGLRLTGRASPLMHASNAASFGLFDVRAGRWDARALEAAGIDPQVLSDVTGATCAIGEFRGIPVSAALGDNQASFIGSVRQPERTVLINMGTGGQISMMSDASGALADAEKRPLTDGDFILVGSSLCAGYAYQLTERFLRSCASLAGCEPGNLYEAMNRAGLDALSRPDLPAVTTLFAGTRRNPHLRAGITGLSTDNFDAPRLVAGVLKGMAQELYDLFEQMLGAGAKKPDLMVGSGNAIRRNPALRRAFEARFNMPLVIPAHDEEAAYGAALAGMAAAGLAPDLRGAQALIRYVE